MTRRRRTFIQQFLAWEAAGGVVLIAAATAAMLVANSPLAPGYFAALAWKLGPLTLGHWINDGLMAVFFFVVGLEIKREWLDGHLSKWSDRHLPLIAALAGMVVPAAIYLAVSGGGALGRGWAIPAATDIAFALGILALLGSRVPASLKLFLTTVAIIDDMGAVAIIALAYTDGLDWLALGAAAALLALLFALNRLGIRHLAVYLGAALLLWVAVHASGVHATIAGVLAAFTVPLGRGKRHSPLYRLEHALHPWSAFMIVPVFGFANAGVSLTGVAPAALLGPLPLGVALGLFVGKQLGIFAAVRLAVAAGVAQRPAGASWPQLYGMALLCGIGFTMSLFIGGLAFPDPALHDQVKLAVLVGSALSALCGYLVLRLTSRHE